MTTMSPGPISSENSQRRAQAKSDRVGPMAVGRLRSIGSSAAVAADPLSPEEELLRKLRVGEFDLEGYYEAMVELSLDQLRSRLSARQLQIVRERIREEIVTNPVLVKMVGDVLAELAEPATR